MIELLDQVYILLEVLNNLTKNIAFVVFVVNLPYTANISKQLLTFTDITAVLCNVLYLGQSFFAVYVAALVNSKVNTIDGKEYHI